MRDEELLVFAIVAIVVLGLLAVQIFYLLTLNRLMNAISPHNRKMQPGNVWLNLIPFFNIIWPFIMNPNIVDSVRAELTERGRPEPGDYGRTMGIMYPAFSAAGIIPFLGYLTAIPTIIFWIIFWVKMSGYKTMIENMGPNTNPQPNPYSNPQVYPQAPATPSTESGTSTGGYEDPFA